MDYNYISRGDLKRRSLASLKGNWPAAIGAVLVPTIFTGCITGIMQTLFGIEVMFNDDLSPKVLFLSLFMEVIFLFALAPLTIGIYSLFTKISRDQQTGLEEIFSKYKTIWLKSVGLQLFVGIKTFLWSLLFVIPGIIAALSYSMAFFIMAEDENVGINQAVELSKAMMKGHKGEFFVLGLSFIGWAILCLIPCGLGYLWLVPYTYTTYANFYNKVSEGFRSSPQ